MNVPRSWGVKTKILLLTTIVFGIGCGARGPAVVVSPEPGAEAVNATAPMDSVQPGDEQAATPTTPPRLSARPYADTPITAFANAMTEVMVAAAQGETMPQLPFPTVGHVDPSAPQLEFRDQNDRPQGELTVLGFGMEVDFIFKTGQPVPDAAPGTEDGRLRTVLYVTRHGLRLLELRSALMDEDAGLPAPQIFSGLDGVAHDLFERVRNDTLAELYLGDLERQIIGNEEVWREASEQRPRPDSIERVRVMAEQFGPTPPVTYYLDDGGVLVRDERGSIFSISFDFEDVNGQLVLESNPLFRVARLP